MLYIVVASSNVDVDSEANHYHYSSTSRVDRTLTDVSGVLSTLTNPTRFASRVEMSVSAVMCRAKESNMPYSRLLKGT